MLGCITHHQVARPFCLLAAYSCMCSSEINLSDLPILNWSKCFLKLGGYVPAMLQNSGDLSQIHFPHAQKALYLLRCQFHGVLQFRRSTQHMRRSPQCIGKLASKLLTLKSSCLLSWQVCIGENCNQSNMQARLHYGRAEGHQSSFKVPIRGIGDVMRGEISALELIESERIESQQAPA